MSYQGRKPFNDFTRTKEISIPYTNNTSAGALTNVPTVGSSHIRFTNATSIASFSLSPSPYADGKAIIITNASANPMTIINGTAGSSGIITGTGGDIILKSQASIWIVYDLFATKWKIVGGTGSGGNGVFKVKALNSIATTLPTGAVTVDAVAISAGDLVLFTNLVSNNNQIYRANGTGLSITSWTAQAVFNESTQVTPVNGDMVWVQLGDIYTQNFLFFSGTDWKNLLNDKFEQTLLDNTTNQDFIYLNSSDTENIIIEYSISRGTTREVGHIYAVQNGSTASVSVVGAGVGSTGVSFNAIVAGGYFILRYTTTNTGTNATLKRTIKAW